MHIVHLFNAIDSDDLILARRALTEGAAFGLGIESRNRLGETPLIRAARSQSTHCLRWLIDQGADVKASEGDGWTSASWATSLGDTETLEFLADRGADLNAADHKGRPLISLAAAQKNLECVNFLIFRGVDVNAADHRGATAAMAATDGADLPCLLALVDAGASMDLDHPEWSRAMEWCKSNGPLGQVCLDFLRSKSCSAQLSNLVGPAPRRPQGAPRI
jgi:ankyrin repeat protein